MAMAALPTQRRLSVSSITLAVHLTLLMLNVCIYLSVTLFPLAHQNILRTIFYTLNLWSKVLREPVTFKRSIIDANNTPDWANSLKPMIPMNLVSKGSIADAHNMAQVNFANK
jgi:Poly (ADP-ribose) glycohydrolase (PARG)